MDNRNQKLEDLLSSKLDGKLSAEQSVELAEAMAKDPALNGVLADLQATKRLLVAGRSKQSLRNDFAASVTLATQKQAVEMGDKAPNWLIPRVFHASTIPSLRKASETRRAVPWLSAGVLSLAATVLLVWLTLPSIKKDEIAVVSNVAVPNVAVPNAGEPDADLAEQRMRSGGQSAIVLQSDKSSPLLPTSPAATQPSDSSQVALVSNEPALGQTNSTWSVRSDANAGVAPKLDLTVATTVPGKTGAKQKLFYTMVLDVSIVPKAEGNRTLEQILEKYNIVYTDDLVIDESQIKSLMDSKLVGIGETEEKMGVMFLRSTAKKLDLAIREIINQVEEFPDFALDITTDPSAELLVKQLGSIQVAEGSDGLAHRLAIGKAGRNSSPFSASARRGRPMPTDSRTTYTGGIVSAGSRGDEMSNVLFLIRTARE